MRHIITLYELQEEFDMALQAIHRAQRITEKVFGGQSLELAGIEIRFGSLCYAKGANVHLPFV